MIIYDAYERLKILFLDNGKAAVENPPIFRVNFPCENDISFSIVDSESNYKEGNEIAS